MPRNKSLSASDPERATKNQPFSINSVDKHARIKGATEVHSVCPYCAVGCSQLVYLKGGTIIDIEGNPESPINGGTLCPKGANTFQLGTNPHRVKKVMYRAPYSDRWESRSLEWAMDRIAHLTMEAREEGFVEELDGVKMDNEENYLIKKLFNGGLGVIPIENQARI